MKRKKNNSPFTGISGPEGKILVERLFHARPYSTLDSVVSTKLRLPELPFTATL